MKIFVIIVTYNGKQWYDRCFTSLRESKVPVQTFVIDNASTDGSAEYIKEHYPEVLLIENKENVGFGRANNQGMRYALDHGCDYVFLLNQDAWLIQDDALERLVYIARHHTEYGIISPMHLTADQKDISIQYENISHECGRELVRDLYCGQLKDIYETDYVNAAAWLLPRKTIEVIGGFDPIFFLYGEDDNYINRVHYHGLKIGVCPSARIIHDHPCSAKTSSQITYLPKKELLVKWTDINYAYSLNRNIRYFLRKYLLFISSGNIKSACDAYSRLKYNIKLNKKIKQSRTNNKQQKQSWLN